MKSSRASSKSKSGSGDDQVVDQPDGELTGGKPYRLVVVGVDHVVAPALALYLPGLTAAHVVADGLLQLQRHMLGYVANPGALVQPLREAASPAATTGVVHQARQPLQQSVGEARQLVGRKVFEHTKIDNELDGGFIVPNVRTAEDPARDDLEIRVWSRGNALGHEVLLTNPSASLVGATGAARAEAIQQDRFAAILPLLGTQSPSGHPGLDM
jgi:hypothetical protein